MSKNRPQSNEPSKKCFKIGLDTGICEKMLQNGIGSLKDKQKRFRMGLRAAEIRRTSKKCFRVTENAKERFRISSRSLGQAKMLQNGPGSKSLKSNSCIGLKKCASEVD